VSGETEKFDPGDPQRNVALASEPAVPGTDETSASTVGPDPGTTFPLVQDLRIYRQARLRTMLAAAVVLLLPFVVFFFLLRERLWEFSPDVHHPELDYLIVCAVLGVLLAVAFGQVVSRHILNLLHKLEKNMRTLEQREHERDQAQAQLIGRLEKERELVKEKLQFESQLAEYEKYAALAQLALGASHEINNPLLGILSHLELELKAAGNTEQKVEIQQCIAATKRIAATMKGLIDYARPGAPRLTRLDIARLVNDTFAFLCHHPLFRNIRLEQQMPADLPEITADPNQISQVLMNLLLNSAQAMPSQGGVITLCAEKVKFAERIEIQVKDTGAGIPPDILPHVFDPFFTTKRGQGTGLGLSITQAYVRNHSGEITASSVPNHGTTVRIVLPIRQDDKKTKRADDMAGEMIG
jgi:signal transduction histidine kinase